jgi:hypothetical protein
MIPEGGSIPEEGTIHAAPSTRVEDTIPEALARRRTEQEVSAGPVLAARPALGAASPDRPVWVVARPVLQVRQAGPVLVAKLGLAAE